MNGPDAVIIQICNVCVGNCSNISNMQRLHGVEVGQICIKQHKHAQVQKILD